jgi:glycosyltransferase involved in cell wall biosynthesis
MKPATIKLRGAQIVVVIPCYNEARRLDLDAIASFLRDSPSVALLFVDDGSTDDTPLLLERIRRQTPTQVCTLRLSSNRGKAEAVRSGLAVALRRQPEIVGYWDADLSAPLEMIPRLAEVLRARPNVQLVMGSRVAMLGRKIRRRLLRHLLGRAFATAASIVLQLPVYDTQCGAKLIRVTPHTAELLSHPFRTRWIFDVELLARFTTSEHTSSESQSAETILYEYPLESWREVDGSNLRPFDFFVAVSDLFGVYKHYMRRASRSESKSANNMQLRIVNDDKRAAA